MQNIVLGFTSGMEYLDTRAARIERPKSEETGADKGGRFSNYVQFGLPMRRADGRLQADDENRLDELGVSQPIDVLVQNGRGLRPSRQFYPHAHASILHTEDLIPTELDGIYACTAPRLYLQGSCGLSDARLVLLGLQLLGTYRELRPASALSYERIPDVYVDYHPRGSNAATCSRATAYNVAPLLTLSQLEQYLAFSRGTYGSRRVGSILPSLVENLASPLEAYWYMLACLPRKRGGLALPAPPKINQPLKLSDEAAKLAGKSHLIPDGYWPEQKVALEILGTLFHTGRAGITDTSRRTKAYRAMGIECLTVTYDEIDDPVAFERSVRAVSRALGLRYRKPTDVYWQKAASLRAELGLKRDRQVASIGTVAIDNEDPGWFEALSHDLEKYGEL